MDRMIRISSVVVLALGLSVFSMACNTIGGIGKDVKTLGGSVEKAADSNEASTTQPSK